MLATEPHDDIATRKLTWRELVKAEPELAELVREARSIHPQGRHFCANAVWYGYYGYPGIKPRLFALVGWEAHNPKLRTSAAWDVAYNHLYRLLPNCRECVCA